MSEHPLSGAFDGDQYKKLEPATFASLDEDYPNWKDRESDVPQKYVVNKHQLILIPAPAIAVADGLWLFFGQSPRVMTSPTYYPFSGSTTEFSHLQPLYLSIIYYWLWQARLILNDGVDSFKVAKSAYETVLAEGMGQIDRRRDIGNYKKAKYGGKKI